MYISVISFRLGEQLEIFQHETLDDAKDEVKKQLAERVEGQDIAQVHQIIPGAKQTKFICNDDDILGFDN